MQCRQQETPRPSGHKIAYFSLFPLPAILGHDDTLADKFARIHQYSQLVLYILVALHVLAVAYHRVWLRDTVLLRMTPRLKR